MQKALLIILVLWGGVALAELSRIPVRQLDGKPLPWAQFSGKTLLLVNIATQCGYTPQLAGLQKIYDQFKDKGFVVVGMPSNDFGGQTPEDARGVQNFCRLNYGVTFPLTEKMHVKGSDKHPLAQNLLAESPSHEEIGWNFEKFLVGPNGKVLARFKSAITPEDDNLQKMIQQNLPH